MIRRLPGGAGQYELMRTGRRDVLMRALPGGVTRVYAPAWMPLREVDALVFARWDELKALHRQLDGCLADEARARPLDDGAALQVCGRPVTLRRRESASPRARLTDTELILYAPAGTPDERLRDMIRVCLSRRALARVRERLEYFIPLVGRAPNRVAVRNQSTRWGSCSSKGNLNFNWKLVLAPPEALDYVVVHELCHLLEFSHSPNFWKLVEKAFPEYKFWKKWLKDHGRELGV